MLLSNEIPFVLRPDPNGRKACLHSSWTCQYFNWMPNFIDVVNMLPRKYEYSEPINAFISCCQALGLLTECLDWNNIWVVDSKKTYPCFGGVSAA
ncbi:MAG: hypothetical protein ACXW2E_12500, partial [Nitrososphaeraceae archaeon]